MPQETRHSPMPLRNKDDKWGKRRIKPLTGPELGVQPGVPPKSTHRPCLSQATALPAASRVWLFGGDTARPLRGLRGGEHLKLTPSCHLQARQPPSVTQNHSSPAACSLLPLLIRSPTVLYYAKIILLLPTKIMSEPSTLPCLMQKAAPQGRGRPGCSYKAY